MPGCGLQMQHWAAPCPSTLAGENRGEPQLPPFPDSLSGVAGAHGASEDEQDAHVWVLTSHTHHNHTPHAHITRVGLHVPGHA